MTQAKSKKRQQKTCKGDTDRIIFTDNERRGEEKRKGEAEKKIISNFAIKKKKRDMGN